MSSSTLKQSSLAEQQTALDNERFIQQQLNRTRFQMRVLELISSLLMIAAGLLAALLLLAVIDHWILPMGLVTRLIAWVLLLGGTAYATIRLMGPLLLHSINPTYAARAIEKQSPSLKNSLINFLLLRSQPQTVRHGMMTALGNQAATDLSLPNVDANVDRSQLIKVGYVFAAILACCAFYKILSPKDPFQSFQRVAIPWANIDRPTRVLIRDVKPGSLDQVYHGQTIAVSAIVQGIDSDEPVTLVYGSFDGQIIEQRIRMQPSKTTHRYEANLPASQSGIQQDLQYYLQAGDSRTKSYQLTVIPSPVIWITRVEYEYPHYTRIPPRTVTRQGDLEALEGTRVTLYAKTNQPIRNASVVFATEQNSDARRSRMTSQQETAKFPFQLQLDKDRTSSLYHSYRLEFVTPQDHRNEDPVIHRIEVTRDLPPEIEFLQPLQQRLEVPVNASQVIELRALDADFGLSRIALRAVAGESDILNQTLFEDPAGQPGQMTRRYNFQPARLGLKPGDEVTLRGTAWDNRVSSQDQFEPNVTRTANYTLVIIPAPEVNPLADEKQNPDQDPDTPPEPGEDTKDKSQQADGAEQGSEGSDANSQPDNGSGNADQNSQESNDPANSDNAGSGNSTGGKPAGSDSPSENATANKSDNPGSGNNESGDEKNPAGNQSSQDNAQPGTNPDTAPAENDDLHDGEIFERVLERMKRETQEEADAKRNPSSKPSEKPDRQEKKQNQPGDDTNTNQGEAGSGDESKDSQQGKTNKGKDPPADSTAGSESPTQPAEGNKPDQPGSQPGNDKQQKTPGNKPDAKQPSDPPDSNSGSKPTTPQKGNPDSAPNTPNQGSPAEGGKSADKPKKGNQPAPRDPDNKGTAPADNNTDSTSSKPSPDKSDSTGNSGSTDNKPPVENGQDSSDKAGTQGKPAGGQKPDQTKQNLESSDPSGSGNSSEESANQPPNSTNRSGDGKDQQSARDRSGGPRQELSDRLLGLPEELPDSDEEKLDYFEEVTDLVLGYLKDQQDNPDTDLLNDLGLTAEELRAMVKRYEELRQQAQLTRGESQVELDETLRSLGLRPSSQRRSRRQQLPKETAGGLNEDAAESGLPEKFRQQFNAFKKGTSRSRN